MRFHLGFPSPSISDVPTSAWHGLAQRVERLGFDCLWHSNERFYRDMFVRMTVSTLATSRLEIGGAIVEPYSVHPAVTAQALATVQELSGGRATVALGAGGSGFPMMAIERKRSSRAVREACELMKGMLAGDSVTLEGEVIQARGAHLHFDPPGPAPVWIATRGDLTLRVAGTVADGAFIATYAQPEQIAQALALVHRGAVEAGRAREAVRVLTRVDTCVHEDPDQALQGSRLMVAKLLWSSYPDRGFVERAGLAVPDELETIIATRDYDALHDAAGLVSDELVATFCWAGTPQQVAQRVARVMRETGISEVGFWALRAPGQSLDEAVGLIAEAVIPALRRIVDGAETGAA